ncbi:hypothetical protein DNHGIG_18410 [Collibacillus ludicampi]|uniref:DUF1659 domain-containing protein n=1 Tax=Collibacillus ludicampi TaxID=2771369 RepID=A0AAV4LER0_9BACL|nr:DUF1659 domain-containing protein [Collibacillus ludicampi]GIM46292.1 hypothetical protein DNHGIG_18410 [Collibacillus ludicampi]
MNKTAGYSSLVLQLQTGTDATGKPKLKQKEFPNVKATATDQDIFEVAQALAKLQGLPLYSVMRVDRAELNQ